MSLSEMLKAIPELSKEDEAVLLRVGSQMQYMADLSNTDIFLDCPIGEGKSLVVAHAQPASGTTAYECDVTGEILDLTGIYTPLGEVVILREGSITKSMIDGVLQVK